MSSSKEKNVRPGINPKVRMDYLSDEEKSILKKLSQVYWYVTNVSIIGNGSKARKVAYLKPVEYITQNFNLTREVVFIFSPHNSFEPRTLDVLDDPELKKLRLEEVCCLVVSKDPNIANVLNSFMKSNTESRIIIPFTYQDLLDQEIEYMVNQMRVSFYSRDLFDIQDPLKQDLYFFGRRDLVQEIVNKHINNENAGIFGLRKTGKTSIIFSVIRTLDRKKSYALLVDCQTLHNLPWNLALRKIIWELINGMQLKQAPFKTNYEKYVDVQLAVDVFNNDLKSIIISSKRDILLIFDEIEHITFETSISSSWKDGDSFIKFWQALRSFSQHNPTKFHFSYLLAGTNPQCVERPSINGVDNPIFAQFKPKYIPPFDFELVDEMLSKLGGYMGLKFDKQTVAAFVSDFGGHPLLIRQMASYIHKNWKSPNRPVIISRHEYDNFKLRFYQDEAGFSQYSLMILQVLKDWYRDEYDMLKYLAEGDIECFKELADEPTFIKHLMNYGIIEADTSPDQYHFKIEALKPHLAKVLRIKKKVVTDIDKETEIQNRRSAIEKNLRKLVKRQLKSTKGETDAKDIIAKAIYGGKDYKHHTHKQYADFFDPNKTQIYLKTLIDVIKSYYSLFKNLFEATKEEFEYKANLLNMYRKVDAHAARISKEDFETFRGIASWFEKILSEE